MKTLKRMLVLLTIAFLMIINNSLVLYAAVPKKNEEKVGYYDFAKENPNIVILIFGIFAFIAIINIIVLHGYRKKTVEISKLNQDYKKALNDAELANESKSNFLARMSHDIRTPLNGILGMTDIARSVNKNEEVEEYLSKIDISGKYLLGLVNDILDMSKIESGKISLNPSDYSEKEFVETMYAIVKPLCDEKKINFHIESNDEAFCIFVDKVRFNQIFLNLLYNAVKFTPIRGDVTLNIHMERKNLHKGRLTVFVSDTGIGIKEEFKKHLFKPFEQENTFTNENRQGSGLGLAITKKIVELLGGSIELESTEGLGATFTVKLDVDLAQEEESVIDEEKSKEVDLTGLNVMVVEDNEINMEIAVMLLENQGAKPDRCYNGIEAVNTFADSSQDYYDLILMDIRMPEMDGLEATEKIRKLNRADAETVPIFAMTANTFEEDIQACFKAGMNGHIAKPVDETVVFSKIAAVVEKRRKIKKLD
ncbi:Signal transduction histidine kinase [Acetitomaculum ruminis DSM 5522]|uniref:Circadian input-output histidine kinase CikA n=1 Tax=Acetitomaculum ruminis DSM 5522 TaxID=1120918 RepID=A0A1I1A8K3_9FIRM|nr:ATP-binding protein [Acetitomaculum ruminis]SFB32743.1 Signal transduction histidine kinase [Acetitomaculum ruminis DSM 5522]